MRNAVNRYTLHVNRGLEVKCVKCIDSKMMIKKRYHISYRRITNN
jgi:hypothetical protein